MQTMKMVKKAVHFMTINSRQSARVKKGGNISELSFDLRAKTDCEAC
jgi:hypothetical protein